MTKVNNNYKINYRERFIFLGVITEEHKVESIQVDTICGIPKAATSDDF